MRHSKLPKNYLALIATLIAFVVVPNVFASDYGYHSSALVDIDIVDDYGRRFKEYPTGSRSHKVKRAYLEAKDGKSYGIKVRNNSNQRVGVVIAVDGRNIISGRKSHLKSNERMYILKPYQRTTYKGWRSGKNRVNEFYFTDVPDSYADRTFGDTSAMGVIAVAVFKEKNGRWYRDHRDYRGNRGRDYDDDDDDRYDDDYEDYDYRYKGKKHSEKKSKPRSKSKSHGKSAPSQKHSRQESYSDEAGTGYGDDRYSPTRRVRFKAKHKAEEKYFLKYEWKQTLCEMGVKRCGRRDRNRFWSRRDNGGYAPPPPSRRYRHYGQGIH